MKKIITALLFSSSLSAVAQNSTQEQINHTFYNKIEFFINSQKTDSIYNLANEGFKKAVPYSSLKNLLETEIYPLGRIQHVEKLNFNNGVTQYLVDFTDKSFTVPFGVDSTMHYHTLGFQPYAKPVADKQEPVMTSTVVGNKMDFFIDSIANEYSKKGNTQSLTIGVIQNEQLSTYFYGETEKGNKILPTSTTLYELGSLSKIFTATLLANLVENGTVKLDQSITDFLPDTLKANPNLKAITFKNLANHTSGLPRLPNNFEKIKGYDANNPYKGYDRKYLYQYLSTFKSDSTAGEKYEYSNLGYAVLGDILTTIYKRNYNTTIQEIIAKPLGLTATSDVINPKTQYLSKVYNAKGDETKSWDFLSFSAARGLKSNVTDLLTFAKAQFKMPETPLENAMALTRQFTYFLPPNTDIGLAWHMDLIDDITYCYHTGGTAGSSSYIAIAPDKKTAVVLLSNAAESVEKTGVSIFNFLLSQK
ncbi:beta-lactamase family protein [Sphingobacterium sp. SRCM116780]|uniref:serine hydrolase domain-containing protein n=1 Tax=Sphingobacterium sp. SRCM116780 TaxID=2907623 RepID=UPI001F30573E|nr:serine hydrolase domain-containing protein [Sphingobacterium sp. SRCM116780]UIR57921.1 beta-lactamase family protein [Sphingobacterium sp. SRCM116780]